MQHSLSQCFGDATSVESSIAFRASTFLRFKLQLPHNEIMQEGISGLLRKFLEEPSVDNFLSLRAAVAESPDYAPYGASPDKACPLLDQEKFAEATAVLRDLIGNYLLNPRIHQYLGFAW